MLPWQSSSWMQCQSHKHILSLYLPGTHNAGAYKKSTSYNNFLKPFAICQTSSVYEQCCKGIRFFDLRICSQRMPYTTLLDKNKKLWISHTFKFYKLQDILDQILKFVNQYSSEIVCLCFDWDYDYRKFVDWELFHELIFEKEENQEFQKRLIKIEEKNYTIGDIVSKFKKNIIMIVPEKGCNDEGIISPSEYYWCREQMTEYRWANKWNINDVIDIEKRWLMLKKQSTSTSTDEEINSFARFYWLKGTVTTNKDVVTGLIKRGIFSIESQCELMNVELLKLLKEVNQWECNVIDMDFLSDEVVNCIVNKNVEI